MWSSENCGVAKIDRTDKEFPIWAKMEEMPNGKFSIGQKSIKKSELGGRTALDLLEIAFSIIWQNLVFLIFSEEKK